MELALLLTLLALDSLVDARLDVTGVLCAGALVPRRLLALPGVTWAARQLSSFVDLQWAIMIRQLTDVAPKARGRLLDVGCGQKPYEQIFRPYVTEYVGLEHEATFAETSSSEHASRPDVYYDGVTIPFEDASFDTLLNIQVLEHTPRPQALVHEMARVLRPGGLLIASVPFSFRLHEEPHDYFRYTPHGLRDMFDRAGLEIVELTAQGSLWSVLGHKLNSFLAFRVARLQGVGQALGKLGHERGARESMRLWAVPWVVPAMALVSGSSRVLDRVLPDETEALSFLAIARHKRRP